MAVAVVLTILATTTSARAQAAIDRSHADRRSRAVAVHRRLHGRGSQRGWPGCRSPRSGAVGRGSDAPARLSAAKCRPRVRRHDDHQRLLRARQPRARSGDRADYAQDLVGQHGAGLVWDLDDFLVNQIGHPYQGNNYFNAGRANGLSFWESAGLTAFGSAHLGVLRRNQPCLAERPGQHHARVASRSERCSIARRGSCATRVQPDVAGCGRKSPPPSSIP